MDTTTISKVHTALQALAGVCDFANKQDGSGFNRFDADFGHQLAHLPTITEGQAVAALKMVRKYRKQLESMGIVLDYDAITTTTTTPTGATAKVNGRVALVYFGRKPADNVRAVLRSIGQWKPNLPEMPWAVPTSELGKLVDVVSLTIIDETPMQETTTTSEPVQVYFKDETTIEPSPNGKHIWVKFSGNYRANADKIKGLPERRWMPDEDGKPWQVAKSCLVQLMGIFPDAVVAPVLLGQAKVQQELASMSRKAETDFQVTGLNLPVYPYQAAGVEFAIKANGRALIADEMGLGKTIQAIGYMAMNPDQRPALIVVPATLKTNWVREIERWLTKGEVVAVLKGGKPEKAQWFGASIIIVNYDILSKWIDHILTEIKPQLIILDEAHYIKNSKSQRSAAAQKIADKIDHVLCLTGTPVTNRPIELYPLLKLIDSSAWGNWWQFAKRYCNLNQNGFGTDATGASNLEELHERIKPYTVRRVKTQVLKELPEKTFVPMVVPFSKEMRAEYTQYIRNALAATTQAEQLAEIEKAKQAAALGKMDAVLEWIENFLAGGNKLVVFGTHHMIIDAIYNRFSTSAVMLTGRQNDKEKQEAVDRFQNDSKINLFVGNIKAAGVGITLTAASDVLVVEFPWTPGDLSQAVDRTHRIGQAMPVTAYYAIAEGTIDEKIVELLESKRVITETIHDGKAAETGFSIVGALITEIKKELGK